MPRLCSAVVISFSISVLSSYAHAAAPRDSGITSPLESLPQSIWEVTADSVARHLQTGMECPFEVTGFMLQNVMTFDGVGFDVGCNYVRAAGGAVTIYLTKRGQQILADEMDRANTELQYTYSDSEKLETPEMPTLFADTPFMSSEYLLTGRNAHSGIWLTDYSGWTLKFRATYLAGDWQPAYDAMTELLASAEPARTHLSDCVQSPSIAREGKRVENSSAKFSVVMSAYISLIAFAELLRIEDSRIAEPIWCVGPAVTVGDSTFLFWTNVAAGEGGPKDKITSSDGAPADVLTVYEVTLSNKAIEEADLTGMHTVYRETDEATLLIGIFEGRPTLEETANLLTSADTQILLSVDKATGNTEIFVSE
ncbi:MAG: hypothetical protein V3S07_08655 [Micropepsaceae bacterium]